jgi:hypothetical protein
MKRILFVLGCAILASTSVRSQDSSSLGTQKTASPGATEPGNASNEELNIRAYIELLRSDVKKSKTQIMSAVMQFDPKQSASFWPIYKDFDSDLSKIGDEIYAHVKNYAENYDNMTADVADELATKLLDIEQQRNALKRKYYERVKSALDPITAARFLQVENQLERLVDLQIAAQLPVIN